MSGYKAEVHWQKAPTETFIDNKYSRDHVWKFDSGIEVPGAPSPHIVSPAFMSERSVDPEEAFIASISSCHMLWFLGLAAVKKIVVASYSDCATGILEKNEDGKMAITSVELNPKIVFGNDENITQEELDKLHHQAHEHCFIANSVTSRITINPQ